VGRLAAPSQVVRRPAVVQVAASLLLAGGLAWWASRQDAPALPGETGGYFALAAALLVYAMATLARGERWYRLLRLAGVSADRRQALELTTVGYMGNNVFPARAGELLRILLLAPRAGASRTRVLGTVVAERALDAVVLLVLMFAFTAGALPDVLDRSTALVLVASTALLAGGILVVWSRRAERLKWLGRLREKIREASAAFHGLRGAEGAGLLLLSTALWVAEGAVYLLVAESVGLSLGALEAISIMVLANLAALVPAGPGYLGTFDAAVILALSGIGIAHGSAVGYLLVLRFVLFVPITAAGLIVYLTKYAGWSRRRRVDLRTTGA
jgi:glycosyltransferase 2 family protein